jgi:hypothetical protein
MLYYVTVCFVQHNESFCFFLLRWHPRCKDLNNVYWWLIFVVFGKRNHFLVWEVKTGYCPKRGCAASCCRGLMSCPAWCRTSERFEVCCIVDIMMTWAIYSKRPIHSQLNWAVLLCDVIPDGKSEYTAQFWQAIAQASELSFPVVFHTENCAFHSGNLTVSSVYLPTPSQGTPLSKMNKREATFAFMKRTDRYRNFGTRHYSNRFIKAAAYDTRTRKHTELTKNWQTWWETCAVSENIQFSFSCSFLHNYTAQFTLEFMGPLRKNSLICYPTHGRLNFVRWCPIFGDLQMGPAHCHPSDA